MTNTTYNPANLLDSVMEKLNLANDAKLAIALNVAPPVISKVRNRKQPVGASLLVRMHEATGLSTVALRALMGDYRDRFSEKPSQ